MNFEKSGKLIAVIVPKTSGQSIRKKLYLDAEPDPQKEGVVDYFSELQLPPGFRFQLAINKKQERQVNYVVGQSGSGKSYFVKQLLQEYVRTYPSRPIFLFSSLAEDETLKPLGDKIQRIELTPDFLADDIQASEFQDSCVVFDDTDCISDKMMRKKVMGLQNQLLETGRHFNTSIFFTNHIANQGHDTRRILNESQALTFFPATMNDRTCKYLLNSTMGLSNKQVERIRQIPSRAITILKSYPPVLVAETFVCLLKDI